MKITKKLGLAGLAWFARGAFRERARRQHQSTPVPK